MSRLLEIITGPWAILPDKLEEIRAIYETRMRGERIDVQAVEASIGRPLANEQQDYEIVDGVAVIPVQGVIARRANLFTSISGGASSDLIARDLRAAASNSRVSAILLQVDSPGGTVAGTQQLASLVREVDASKPVVAVGDGTMASAAYWIAAAARQVFVADGTTEVGSIGVVTAHRDISGAQAQAGTKVTEIYAGQYKRIASTYAALTESGRAYMQDQVDYLYTQFVQAVADYRGVSVDQVLADMADGRIFHGQRAVDAGLVDGIATPEQLIARLAVGEFSSTGSASPPRSSTRAEVPTPPKGNSMSITTREELAAEAPELLNTIEAAASAAGASAERARILGVEAHSMPGHEKLIASLKADGKTTPDQAAAAVLAAHRGALAAQASAIAADAPAALPAALPEAEPAAKPTASAIAARAGDLVAQAAGKGQTLSYAEAAAQASKELSQA